MSQNLLAYCGLKKLTPYRVSLFYAVFSILWITVSSYITSVVNGTTLHSPVDLSEDLLLVFVTSGLLYFLLNVCSNRHALAEQQLLENEANYRSLADSGPALVWTSGTDKLCNYFNKVWLDFTGRSIEQELGDGWTASVHPDDLQHCLLVYSQAFDAQQAFSMDYRMRRHDGKYRWLQDDGCPRYNAAGEFIGYIGYCLDISERKQNEAKIHRLSNLYAALSQCNQAILRCSSEAELFPQICRDAVSFGQMQMAWIGVIDPDSQQVIPVASFGKGTDYLNDLHLSIDVNSPFGRGPTGTAIRNDWPVWCQDFLNDPITAPWHERAMAFGWRSSAALPLHRNGLVTGIFNVYSDEVGAFDETEQNLLLEMAMDISYAIDRFEQDRQRKILTDELQHTRAKMDSILGNIDQVIWSVDAVTHQVLFLNPAAETIYGRTVEEFFNQPQLWLTAVHPDDMTLALEMDKQVRIVGSGAAEFRIIRPNGDVRWIHDQAWCIYDDDGKVLRLDGVVSDITDRKQAEFHIQHLAYYDALTGLPNRTLLYDRVSQAINLAVRNHTQMVLIFLDLDHFKNINDILGHRIGDQLLSNAAQRMKAAVREEDTVARPGGDEFILTLIDTDTDGAAHVAEKILTAMSQPFTIEEHELVVTASLGIAMYPNDGNDFHGLAQCADAAMYRAKQDGRNCYRFFSTEMQAHSARALFLQNALHRALEQEQLHVQYQPQFSLQSGEIIGIEALVRWQHPELGMISPAEFIPIAENSGQIMAIGEWVLRTSLRQLKCWRDSGMVDISIAVNLSAIQFNHTRLPELIVQILDEVQLPPHALVLELTESVSMDNPLAAIAIMDKLHDRGVRMSIDDFGTGYSSLSYLKRFQVHKLKIDQSFVRDITDDPQDRAIVTAIINLSRSFGLRTIAEGVETAGQLAFLREQGCDEVQGYYFSKPLSAEQLLAFVRNYIPSAGDSA